MLDQSFEQRIRLRQIIEAQDRKVVLRSTRGMEREALQNVGALLDTMWGCSMLLPRSLKVGFIIYTLMQLNTLPH